jgi:hypothetical protein
MVSFARAFDIPLSKVYDNMNMHPCMIIANNK